MRAASIPWAAAALFSASSFPACSLEPQPTQQQLEARLCTQRGEDRVDLEEDTSPAVHLMVLEPMERFVSLTQTNVYGGELRRRDALALLASLMQLGKMMATNPPGQVAHIDALVYAAEAAWAAKDAAAYAAPYTEDVHFIGSVGNLIVGREALRVQHVFLFSTIFSQSTQTLEIRRIEFLTGTIAIVELNTTLTGLAGETVARNMSPAIDKGS